MPHHLDVIFSALSDPTRRAILSNLAAGEAQVGEIAAKFPISAPAISRHLKVLEEAGLVTRRVEAQRRIISLNPEALRTASRWVDQYRRFWEGSLDNLESLLVQGAEDDRRNPTKDSDKGRNAHDQTGKPRRRR